MTTPNKIPMNAYYIAGLIVTVWLTIAIVLR